MALLKLSAYSEIHERKKGVAFGGHGRKSDRCFVFGCNPLCVAGSIELNLSSSFCLKEKPNRISFVESCNCVLNEGNENPFDRFREFGVYASIPKLPSAEVRELGRVRDAKRLILKNPEADSVQVGNNSRKNDNRRRSGLWKQFHSAKKSGKNFPPLLIHKKGCSDSDPNINHEIESWLSSIGPESSVEQCNHLLMLLEKANNEKTLDFFDWMRNNGKLKENADAYNLVFRALGRKEDWNSAEELLREMTSNSECKINCQVFNTLIYWCYKRVLTQQGSKWFQMMLDNGIEPNIATFGMLMSLYQKGGNLEEAEFAFGRMRGCGICCVSAYSAMITICTRLGLYDKAEEVIKLMEEDDVIPNLENWLVRVNAYSQQGKLEEAELVLKSMEEVGIPPNIIAYNTLITGYGKMGDMESSQRLFRNLPSMGLEPDETTYRSMVEGFGRVDNYEETMRYYNELKLLGYSPISSNFYTVINLQARHNDDDGAVQTIRDMRSMGCQYSSILSSLLQSYERVVKVYKLPYILKSSFYQKILLDQTSCSILVTAYVQHSLLDDALRILKEKQWIDPVFEDNLYHLLICLCKEMDQSDNAVKIYLQMPKSEENPNLHITCSMIDIYSAMGQFCEAETLYLKLKDSGTTLDMVAYSIVVRMYIKAGSVKESCAVLEMMEKQKDIIPDVYLFRDMLRVYQQCGMLEKLADTYYRMLKIGIVWDEAMYNCLINCCGHALPVDEISRLFDEMLQYGFAANTITFNVMIDVYGKAGLFKRARRVLWIARKRGLADVISFNTIIAWYGQMKDFKRMKSAVRQMQYAGFPVSLEAYNCMLDAYGKEDQLDEFQEVLEMMKQDRCSSDHYTYNIMINIYGKKGWIEEVADVLAELKERGMEPDLYSYNTLIKAYGIAGMVEEAVNVVKEMREKGIVPDRITYSNLIVALQKNDNFLEAVKWSLWMKQMGLSSSQS
ncbi:Pentatricopeptide repeat-containing protein [Acorus calamus]|uniref:Pentatricopeptide repeat-containing protein n=1 Tax=Acorus calamus TaxID=4465 RepID=A0AAV9CWU7_ACOCL|nr:Pentatricopeptide repeat-containing protein [Acorus calamus]